MNKLKFKFSKLPHQEKAIENITKVFEGIKCAIPDDGKSNPRIDMISSSSIIRDNIGKIRKEDNIIPGNVSCDQAPIELDILMETGTGKTFTFIESIFKLNNLLNLSKFIILVPSSPIRKGALKNIDVTQDFFRREYGKSISVYDYSSSSVESYIHNSNKSISVLVMTYQSFNNIKNTINQENLETNFFSRARSHMQAIAALKPVIIMDEPHRFTGAKTQQFLPSFEPQIVFRYGATFRNDYKNLIYVLDGVDAFKGNLVKSITVSGISRTGISDLSLHYGGYTGTAKERKAIISYDGGKKSVSLAAGESLGSKLHHDYLNDYVIEKITKQEIIFANGETLEQDYRQDYSGLAKLKLEKMLQETIQTHFGKEERLFKKGIKALSLIFVDTRKKYKQDDGSPGEMAKSFEKIYKAELNSVLKNKSLYPEYRNYLERTAEEIDKVHNGYFAISRKVKDEDAIIDLILEKKEELLSHSTDLRFIFSMWALQEGWDNPNIFTICKLAPCGSHITKLQQIGRGLRLAVRQTKGGFERVTIDNFHQSDFEEINELDVIIPEEESAFVNAIQNEVEKHNIHSKTNFISDKKLCELEICANPRAANKLLNVLFDFNQIELDDETGSGKIIDNERINEVIQSAIEKQNIIFDKEKLAKLFNAYFTFDSKITSKSKKRGEEAAINKKNWPKFKILWDDINRDSSYEFSINQDKLIASIVHKINKDLNISRIKFVKTAIHKAELKDTAKIAESTASNITEDSNYSFYSFREFANKISDSTKLSFHSVVKILQDIDENKFKMLPNDEVRAIRKISEICNREINDHMLESLKFTIHDTAQGSTSLTGTNGEVLESIKLSSMGRSLYNIQPGSIKNKSLTSDKIGYDSEFEMQTIKESDFEDIDVFAKIPEIRIPIPGGSKYNPDFAYVVNNKNKNVESPKYHLVIESKGYPNDDSLRHNEEFKIEVAKRFFKALMQKTNIPIGYEVLHDEQNTRHGLITKFADFENKLLAKKNKDSK
ncbi:MAG: DEAD/DEAH box helicase family protein [Gammaproteobacteria bacterium]|nr:DEAD/DEAH box helicase family protein [Gammaproteobacteria bacterium]